jgi:predicted house-cleaning noncanonical NTP pyrophosphatase (MazG superfamily)
MADVLEVLFTICEPHGYSIDELMKVRDEKRENRGGFKEKIFWDGNE